MSEFKVGDRVRVKSVTGPETQSAGRGRAGAEGVILEVDADEPYIDFGDLGKWYAEAYDLELIEARHTFEPGDKIRIVKLDGVLTRTAGEHVVGDVATIERVYENDAPFTDEGWGAWAVVDFPDGRWSVNLADVECAGAGQ